MPGADEAHDRNYREREGEDDVAALSPNFRTTFENITFYQRAI
jgi:hypothetical protein